MSIPPELYEDSTAVRFVREALETMAGALEQAPELPTNTQIAEAIDGNHVGSSLWDAINYAHDIATEIAYDEFPAFREDTEEHA